MATPTTASAKISEGGRPFPGRTFKKGERYTGGYAFEGFAGIPQGFVSIPKIKDLKRVLAKLSLSRSRWTGIPHVVLAVGDGWHGEGSWGVCVYLTFAPGPGCVDKSGITCHGVLGFACTPGTYGASVKTEGKSLT